MYHTDIVVYAVDLADDFHHEFVAPRRSTSRAATKEVPRWSAFLRFIDDEIGREVGRRRSEQHPFGP